tara:strand:+ start:81 stop:293 length:213 start_codon:yes stop_codon:yes gene_type:complete
MTQLIERGDPRFFTQTSDGQYDRHHYKVVSKTGESFVVDDYMLAQEIWWNRKMFLSHIEVLDIVKSKGFK